MIFHSFLLFVFMFIMGARTEVSITLRPGGCKDPSNAIGLPLLQDGLCQTSLSAGVQFPNNSPAGGYFIQGLGNSHPHLSVQIGQTHEHEGGCGALVGQFQDDGCYDNLTLGGVTTWSVCRTGIDCADMGNGKGTVSVPNVYSFEPQDCKMLDPASHECTDDATVLCIDCHQSLGSAVRASEEVMCPVGPGSCTITFDKTVTVTNGYQVNLGLDFSTKVLSGLLPGDASLSLGFTYSQSVATTHSTSEGLAIPPGTAGFAQYEPPAWVGTLATVSKKALSDIKSCTKKGACDKSEKCKEICKTPAQHLCNVGVCSWGTGSVVMKDTDDTHGRYSIVKTG